MGEISNRVVKSNMRHTWTIKSALWILEFANKHVQISDLLSSQDG